MTVINRFFDWYEKYTEHNVLIAAVLFATQVLHLTWLGLFVIADKLTGQPIWEPGDMAQTLLIFFDYFEIPALLTASLLYINYLRKKQNVRRAWAYLLFINIQWLHIFWITDEFVVEKFTASAHTTILPLAIAWIAILIDYLEVPVMIDTFRRSIVILKRRFSRIH